MWALLLLAGAAAAARPAPLQMRRCCPAGQRLAEPRPDAACTDAPDAALWVPRVFAPARREYLARLPAHWHAAVGAPDCDGGPLRALGERAPGYALLANNASLVLRGATLPPSRYCVDAAAALYCAADEPRALPVCCPPRQAWDGSRCAAGDDATDADALATQELSAAAASVGLPLSAGFPACAQGYAAMGRLADASPGEDGSLRLPSSSLAAGAWCATGELPAPGLNASRGALVLGCAAEATAPPVVHAVVGAALAVGALFLLATLLAGFTLPATHRALHWRCQTHYVAALFLGDVLLAATQLAGGDVPPDLCRALAVCMHFLFLAAFFWLNTMCFNIWWTFRDFRPTSAERSQEAWRLRVYQVYAWGGPLLLAGAAAALDGVPADAAGGALRPRFAQRRCWFAGDAEVLAYFFGPVAVLLLVNLALFASTARQLACGLWRRDEVKSTSERAALGRVCAKLVVVMGVTWGADVVSWAAGGPRLLWLATDLLNALQGVLIFGVVGWHAHARAALRRLLARCGGAASNAAPAPPALSSSHLPSFGDSTHTSQVAHAPSAASASASATAPGARLPMETVC